MKKYIIILLIFIVFSGCTCTRGIIGSNVPRGDIETTEYDLRFGVISDTHVGATNYGAVDYPTHQRLGKVLDWYNTQDVKALVINGDITERGIQNHWNIFKNTWELHKGRLQLIAVAGNHDFRYEDANAHAFRFEVATGRKINAHYVINGYHFIVLNMGEGNFIDSGAVGGAISSGRTDIPGLWTNTSYVIPISVKEWVRKRINIAKIAMPGKPIFVFFHWPIRSSLHYGSSPDTYFFNDDPEVVIFGGHTHRPNNDPRAIWQEGYTSVNTVTLHYISMGSDYIGNNVDGTANSNIPKGGDTMGQGMIVSVKGSKVKIENYDFDFIEGPRPISGIERIPQTWEFDVTRPADFPYTEAKRNEQKTIPVFDDTKPANAALGGIILNTISGTSVEIEFPQAKIPGPNYGNEVVHSYRFDFYKTGNIVHSVKQWSDFMLTPRLQKPTYTQLIGGLGPNTNYELRIYAYGSFQECSSQYLTCTFTTSTQ